MKGVLKMKIFRTFLAVLLSLLLCLSVFTACNSGNNEESSSEQTTNAPEQTTDAPEQTTDAESTDTSVEAQRFDYFNADLSAYITVDPEIYKNLVLEIDKKHEITDELLDEYINDIVSGFPNIVEVKDRAIAEGDTVYIYYEGYIDGELFEGGSNMDSDTPHELKIGSGAFIPGFEDDLIGVIPSDTSRENPATVNATFPESYHSTDLAGKEAVFKVVVEYIAEEEPAELNEEFVTKNFGLKSEDGDVIEQFKALAREDLSISLRSVVASEAYNALVGKFEIIKYPEEDITYYTNYYKSQFESSYNNYLSNKDYYLSIGLSFDSFEDFMAYALDLKEGEDWEEKTLEKCKLYIEETLIVFAIAQKEGFKIEEEDYKESLEYLTKYYISYYYQNYGYAFSEEQIQSMIGSDAVNEHAITEKFIDLIMEHSTINYVTKEQ